MKIERKPARIVKPDGASPEGLGSWIHLSSSDFVVPRVHVEVLYAFDSAAAPSTSVLESGLAKVLTHYREWAGRLAVNSGTGRPGIHLCDEGVVLIEASANGPLADLAPFKPSRDLLELIPVNRGAPELLLIQLTQFRCGGLALGVARHHQVADGEAASDFMDAWAHTVRGLSMPFIPLHDRSSLMAKDPPQPLFDHIEYQSPPQKPDAATKEYPDLAINKLHFSPEFLMKIKAKAVVGAPEGVKYTTFESLLAHMWRCITKARGLEDGETRALIAVNARKRLNPSLPKEYFGNAMCHTCPKAVITELVSQPLSFAAALVHGAIKRVSNEYVRSAFDFIEIQQKNPVQIARTNKTVLTPNLSVTSWVNLPLYKLDFGHGTPTFAGNPFIPFEGLVIFAPTKDGGIDVVLGLFAPDMAKLESICFNIE